MNNQDFYSKTITREEYEQNLVEIFEDFTKYMMHILIFFLIMLSTVSLKRGYLSKI
jgi:hypothetical protein